MSKLTDGFEDREHSSCEVGPFFWVHDVEELLAHARALEAMLEKHQFDKYISCVECGGEIPYGHSNDCEIWRLLK